MVVIKAVELKKGFHISHSGVIPYTIIEGKVKFLFAKDKKYKEYCDFGGGPHKGENGLMAGIREFKEESNEIFDNHYYDPYAELYQKTPAIFDKPKCEIFKNENDRWKNLESKGSTAIIFVPLDRKWYFLAKSHFSKKSNKEVEDVRWISQEDICNEESIWSDIRKILEQHIKTTNILSLLVET